MNIDSEFWRTVAIEHLPMHSQLVGRASSHVDLWQQLKEVVADSNDTLEVEQLRPIFAYAWWCVDESNNPDLAVAAETCFYQDLPAYSDTSGSIRHFIDQKQFSRLRSSFSARIDESEFKAIFAQFEIWHRDRMFRPPDRDITK